VGASADYLDYIRILPGVFVFEFPAGFVNHGSSKSFDIEISVTDQDDKVSATTVTIVVQKAPSKDNSLFMIGMLATE